MNRRSPLPMHVASILAALVAACLAFPANASAPVAASAGPGHGLDLPRTRDGRDWGQLLMSYDGSAENGYCWQYGGIVPPYYGAFAECYEYEYGYTQVTGIELKLTGLGGAWGPLDAYVWADDGGRPGSVLAITTGLLPTSVPVWPEVGTNDFFLIPPVGADGPFWIGYWSDCSGGPCSYFIAADLDGPGGCPYTNIAPGIGYPTGWQDVSVVWGPTRALGIGAWLWGDTPVGACCFADGTCRGTYTPSECAEQSGEWMGYGPCFPNPCEQPLGACCYPDGSCVFTARNCCPNGTWQSGVSCETAGCDQSSLGACCVGNDCFLSTDEGCPGRWLGPGEDCGSGACPPAAPDSARCVDYSAYLRPMGSTPLSDNDNDLAVAGDLAYVVEGRVGLKVIDLSDPWFPRVLGRVEVPNRGEQVAVAGGYAYLASWGGDEWWSRGSLEVIDIADPQHPRIAASLTIEDYAGAVAVADHRAYVTTWYSDYDDHGHLLIYDVTDPLNPQWAGDLTTPSGLSDVAVQGTYAYITGGGFHVVDVSDPLHPRIVASLETDAGGVAVRGTRAYVVGGSTGLQVIDITDPEHPRMMGSAPVYMHDQVSIGLSGDYALASGGIFSTGGLCVVDISEPSQPAIVGGLEGPFSHVAVSGTRAYLAGWERFLVMDISNPKSPPVLGAASTPDEALGVAVSGDHAYVAARSAGLQVIDISDLGSPEIVGSAPTPGDATAVAVSGNYAYVGYAGGLVAVDITNPEAPVPSSILTGLGGPAGVAVLGGHAYLAEPGFPQGCLRVLDIENPRLPFLVGSLVIPGGVNGVAVARPSTHTYAYLAADYPCRFEVVDVTDPGSPTLVGSWAMDYQQAFGVATEGNCAYVSGTQFSVIDVSNPRSPRLVGSVAAGGDGIALAGPYAYVADTDVLHVIDISVPGDPWWVGGSLYRRDGPTPYLGKDLAAGDSLVCIAAGVGGLRILPAQCEALYPSGLAEIWQPAAGLRLSAFPEPASQATTIRLTLPARGHVRVTLHDVAGRRVRGLYDGLLDAGPHGLSWDGTDDAGRGVPVGIYLARASASGEVTTARVVILR